MAFQAGSVDSSTYALLNGALLANGFDNIKVFFQTAFADYYSQVKWTSFYNEAAGSYRKEYTQILADKSIPVMARYVSYDGEAPKISTDQITVTSDNMPRMKLSFDTNEKAMDELQKLMQQMNAMPNYDQLFNQFTTNTAKLLSGIHEQISYTGLQVLSTGKYTSTSVNNGGGIVGLQFDFQVPALNKKKAGGFASNGHAWGTKYAWSSDSAYPIGDLLDIQQYSIDNFIPIGEFNMNKATWMTFKNHLTTRKAVALQISGGMVAPENISSYQVTAAQIVAYVDGLGLPPIVVIDDLFTLPVYDSASRSIQNSRIRGFADNTVVARPSGMVGDLQWSFPNTAFGTPADPIYLTEGGKFSVQQITNPKKKTMEFIAEFTGMTVPDNVNYLLYLDISQAAA